MLQKEDLEAVIMAPPLWAHADIAVGCLDAAKRPLREDDGVGRAELRAHERGGAEKQQGPRDCVSAVVESPLYQAAYDGILQTGTLGDIYHVRLAWHRNGSWRRRGEPPAPDYDPSKWGYPDWDHLLNWRLLEILPGTDGELCSHQINAANWFLDPRRRPSLPRAASTVFLKATARSTTTSTRRSTIPAAAR